MNRCGDCDYLNYKDTKWGGEKVWCNNKGCYTKPGDPACNLYSYHNHNYGTSSSCYLTTLMCDILNYEDNCKILNTLRGLRNNYMKKEVDCFDLLDEYKLFGPEICEKINKDKNKKIVALTMLKHYIEPAIKKINSKEYDEAIDIYIEMTNHLINKYDIDTSKEAISRKRKPQYCFYR